MNAHLSPASGLLLFLALQAPLGCGGLILYDVTRTPVEDCDINPSGEFCGDVGPPVEEKYAIEVRDKSTFVYAGDETWVTNQSEGIRSFLKEERVTREPGPCTSSRRRVLLFELIDEGSQDETLNGSLEVSHRIEGPAVCGDTPVGTRVLYQLTGTRSEFF